MKVIYQSYNELIKHIDEFELIKKYIPQAAFKHFKSPFRKDSTPSAIIYIGRNGRLRFTDFKYDMSIIDTISLLLGKGYNDTLKTIQFENQLTHDKNNYLNYEFKSIIPTKITPYYRNWRDYDFKYWGNGGITKEWITNPKVGVHPIIKAIVESKKGIYPIYCDRYAYVYKYHIFDEIQRYKIYQPFRKEGKWISNINSGVGGVFQLWETLPKNNGNELLIISSSLKDSGAIFCNTNIWSGAPNNEGSWLPPQIIYKLNQRFKRILTWFDTDDAGIRNMKRFKERYGWDYIYIPERYHTKDQFDFVKKYGKKEFISLTNKLIIND